MSYQYEKEACQFYVNVIDVNQNKVNLVLAGQIDK